MNHEGTRISTMTQTERTIQSIQPVNASTARPEEAVRARATGRVPPIGRQASDPWAHA